MGPELLLAVTGPLVGALFGVTTFLYKRTVNRVEENISDLTGLVRETSKQVMEMKIALPERYLTKDELLLHIQSEVNWQDKTETFMEQSREDISSIKRSVHDIELQICDLKHFHYPHGRSSGSAPKKPGYEKDGNW